MSDAGRGKPEWRFLVDDFGALIERDFAGSKDLFEITGCDLKLGTGIGRE